MNTKIIKILKELLAALLMGIALGASTIGVFLSSWLGAIIAIVAFLGSLYLSWEEYDNE